jgi:LuxR family maltose regulon positive regulatory protein
MSSGEDTESGDAGAAEQARLLRWPGRGTATRSGALSRLHPPPLIAGTVRRTGLLRRIDPDALAPRVWLLVAAVGCGKTTLLMQLGQRAVQAVRPVAWLALQAAHSHPERFLALLEAACGVASRSGPLPAASRLPEAGGGRLSGKDAGECAWAAIEWVEAAVERLLVCVRASKLVLCIDGLEELRDPTGLHLLERLALQWPEGAALYCAGRTLRTLHLGRAVLDGTVAEIDARALAFDSAELAELAQTLGVEAARSAPGSELHSAAGGWIAGERALLLSKRESTAAAAVVPSLLARYLEEQLCETLAVHQLELLMDLAALESFNLAMAGELPDRPQGQRILQELRDEGVHIESFERECSHALNEWYRLPFLLQQFLSLRLQRTNPSRSLTLHRFAANWLEQHAYPEDAVRHAAHCNDREYSAAVIERAGAFRLGLREGVSIFRMDGASGYLDATQHPLIALGQVYMMAQDGRVAEARARYEDMRAASNGFDWTGHSQDPEARRLTDLLETVLDFYEDKAFSDEAVQRLQMHVDAAAEVDPLVRASIASLLALAYVGNGLIQEACTVCEIGLAVVRNQRAAHVNFYLRVQQAHAAIALGRLQEAALQVEQARALARAAPGGWPPGVAISDVLRGVLHYEANELDEAEELLARALSREPAFSPWFEIYALGYSAKVAIAGMRRGPAAVAGTVAEIEAHARMLRWPRLADLAAVLRLREAVRAANLPYAMELLRGEHLSRLTAATDGPLDNWKLRLRTLALLEGARLLGKLERSGDGLSLLARIDRRYIYAGDARVRFTFLALTSALTFRMSRLPEAFDCFTRAMELALESGLTRRLLNYRADLLRVFDWAMSSGRPISSRTAAFCASGLRSAHDAESRIALDRRLLPGNRPGRSVESNLSPREGEILRFIAEGLSTKEIAHRLSVSVSTVKTHRKKLYEKLGVNRRSQAIARARAKCLI